MSDMGTMEKVQPQMVDKITKAHFNSKALQTLYIQRIQLLEIESY